MRHSPHAQCEARDLAIDWSRHIRPTQPPFSIEPRCVGCCHGNLVKLQRLFLFLQSCFGIVLLGYTLLLSGEGIVIRLFGREPISGERCHAAKIYIR